MPNANGQDTQEMLWQVKSELMQLSSQIQSINATIKPWQDELIQLRDYKKQLEELEETLQRRKIKPRIVTIERTTKVTTPLDSASKQMIEVLRNMSQADLDAFCLMVETSNATDEVQIETIDVEEQ